jgi:hypothetical protein
VTTTRDARRRHSNITIRDSTMTELRDLARQFADLARQVRTDAQLTELAVHAAGKRVDQHLVHASGWKPTLPLCALLPPGWRDDRGR